MIKYLLIVGLLDGGYGLHPLNYVSEGELKPMSFEACIHLSHVLTRSGDLGKMACVPEGIVDQYLEWHPGEYIEDHRS